MAHPTETQSIETVGVLPPPTLHSIEASQWGEFVDHLNQSVPGLERDTTVSALVHIVADESYPVDVRKSTLYLMSGIDRSARSSFSLGVALLDSDDTPAFLAETRSTLDKAFGINPELAEFGAEIGANLYESGRHTSRVTEHPEAPMLFIAAALPHLSADDPLSARAIEALAQTSVAHGSDGFDHGAISHAVSKIIIDPRVDIKQREAFISRISVLTRRAQHPEFAEVRTHVAEAHLIDGATDAFIDNPDGDPSLLREYFDNAAYAHVSGESTLTGIKGFPAVGLERIATLEQILGSKHPYIGIVVAGRVFGQYASHYRFEEAIASADELQNTDLKQQVNSVVLGLRSQQRKNQQEYEARRENARLMVNKFLTALRT